MAKLVVETEVNIKKAEKDLDKFKKELLKYQEEGKKLLEQKENISLTSNIEEETKKLEVFEKTLERAKAIYKSLEQNRITSAQSWKDFEEGKIAVQNISNKVEEQRQKVKEANEEYEKQTQLLNEIDKQIDENKKSQDNLKKTIDATTQKIEDAKNKSQGMNLGFDKATKSLKRFALGLFGIRTAFTGLRRATSAYLAENEVTANKMNAIWVALGNALGPLIEIIANGVLKLIGYLNVFLNALGFKVDLTKNIGKNTKAIKEQTKAQKELNRQTASFDEMNVMSSNTSAGGGGGGAGSNAFSMPELNENIVNKLKDLAKWLKENWDWIWKVGAALGAVFGIAKISGLLGNIGKLLGNDATGLLGLTGILKGLLALELITITIAIVYYSQELKKVKQDNENLVKWNKSLTKETNKVNKANLEVAKSYEKGSEEIEKYTTEIFSQIEAEEGSIVAHQKQNKEMGLLDNMFDVFGGTREKNNQLTKESTQRIIDNVAKLQELAKEGKLTDEQMKIYNQTMSKLTETQKSMAPFVETNSFLFDKETYALYQQINTLKENEKQFSTTVGGQKKGINDLYTVFKNKFSEINKLKANPSVEVKTDTSKLKSLSDVLSSSGIFNSSLFSGLKNKLKSLGLARGGIINLPGKGVSLGTSIVGGEATGGAEGVVPMNNEESMNVLGQAIAKYVNINITSNTLLDGKVIAREQKKLSDNTDFATNGRGIQ